MAAYVIGLDVGKTKHAATVMAADGTIQQRRTVAQNEPALRAFFSDVRQDGAVTLVVDHCASIGQLVCAVAHDLEIPVQYLPGSTFRAVADTFPGQTKTDQRDADIIATAGWTMPHAVRSVPPMDAATAEIKVVSGHLEAITQDLTRSKNQLRGLLHDMHPPLEQLVGPRLDQAGVLPMLIAWPTPQALALATDDDLMAVLRQHDSRRASTLVTDLRTALAQQTLIMPGTERLGTAIAYRAQQCLITMQEKRAVTRELEDLLAVHPTARLVATMPGYGPTTTAMVVVEVAGKTFKTDGHLASYAGVAPTVRQSGSKRVVKATHAANTRLKNALCWAAFNTIRSGEGQRYYQEKRKTHLHWQAIVALARKQVAILYAILRDGVPYRDTTSPPLTPT